jgi:tetratricopeptide (TPR) repeat protein
MPSLLLTNLTAGEAMTDVSGSGGAAQRAQYVIENSGIIGAVGDDAIVNMFIPRRPVAWPVRTGSPPPLASAFQPRPDIEEKFRSSSRAVLRGGGGTGKTQLAVSAYTSGDLDLRVWVSGESTDSITAGYADAAVQLDLADVDSGAEKLAKGFLYFLASTNQSWIVVIDDLADPNDMTTLWPTGAGQVLVTTRRRDAALSGGQRMVFDVDVYSPDEAQSYLHERLIAQADELPTNALEQAEDLAQDLGYLPLALSQAAAVIVDQAVSCAEYRQWFADRTRQLEDLLPADADADGYAKAITTTWVLAIDTADKLKPVGLSRHLARLAACLDPAGTPQDVYTSEPTREFLARASGQDEVSIDSARAALRVLHRLSLLTHDPRREPATVRMHSLTGRAIRQTYSAQDITELVQTASASLERAWPEVENSPALSESLRANTSALYKLHPEAIWNTANSEVVAPLLFRSGRSLLNAGQTTAAIVYHRDLLGQSRARLGRSRTTMVAQNNLAAAYDQAGDHSRAGWLLEQTAMDAGRFLGRDHPDTLSSWNNLASVYAAAGEFQRAIKLHEWTLSETTRALGSHHPETLACQNNLGYAYALAGDFKQAIRLYEKTLIEREQVLGVNHADTSVSRNNLAFAYSSAGDPNRAIPLYEQNLEERESVLGVDHPHIMSYRNNLAGAYRSSGQVGRAITLYEQTVTDRERVLGADHPETLTSRSNLAGAYNSVGDSQRAIDIYEQALAGCERVLGMNHPRTLMCGNNLAYAYWSVGDLERAIPLYEQYLPAFDCVLGPDHPDSISTRTNLAYAYIRAGDVRHAIPLFEQISAGLERVLGAEHPDTLEAREDLAKARKASERNLPELERNGGTGRPDVLDALKNAADTYLSVGDVEQAFPFYVRALVGREQNLGIDHPDTLVSRADLAYVYWVAGDHEFSIHLFQRTLADCERIHGSDHPDTLACRNGLARAYQSAGKLQEAVQMFEQLLHGCERVLGVDKFHTLDARVDLASVYESTGDIRRAIPLLEINMTDRERISGPDHPSTLIARNRLGEIYVAAGDYRQAVPLFERNLADCGRVFGAEHPNTLISQKNFAEALNAARDTT